VTRHPSVQSDFAEPAPPSLFMETHPSFLVGERVSESVIGMLNHKNDQ
jgi:hypothetical protein